VDYHVYELPDGVMRVSLLNTDWTKPRNTKNIVLHTKEREIPLSVREGELTNLLVDHRFAISTTVPGSVVQILGSLGGQATLNVSGSGRRIFALFSDKTVKPPASHDSTFSINDNVLTVDFGTHWSEKVIRLDILE
jgi:hypothetical protein